MTVRGYVMVDGVAAGMEEPVIAATDMGFLHGDTLFTTLAVHDGRPVLWKAHYARLFESAHRFAFSPLPSPEHLLGELLETIRIQPEPPSGLRVTLSRGRALSPGIDGASEACVRVILPLFRPPRSEARLREGSLAETFPLPWDPAADPRFGHKTGNLLWVKGIRRLRRHPESADQLLLGPRGEILEGTVSSVFAVDADGVLTTAPLSAGILPGIMRGELLSWARRQGLPVCEAAPLFAEAASFREIFLTSSTLPVLPLHTVSDPAGAIRLSRDHPVALAFLDHYRSRIETGEEEG